MLQYYKLNDSFNLMAMICRSGIRQKSRSLVSHHIKEMTERFRIQLAV